MVVDTSALVAIMLREPEAAPFRTAIIGCAAPLMSTASVLEATMVLHGKGVAEATAALSGVLDVLGIETMPVSLDEGALACEAFLRFGRGRHPAGLNLGDCFSYALARSRGLPLLFKGDDFAKTDIVPAWQP